MPSTFSRPLPPTPTLSMLGRLADLLPWPLLVLEPDATLVYANQAGRDLLALAAPLLEDGLGRIAPASAAQRVAFDEALSRANATGGASLRWPGREQPYLGRLERLRGEGPALVLLSMSLPPGQAADWPAAM